MRLNGGMAEGDNIKDNEFEKKSHANKKDYLLYNLPSVEEEIVKCRKKKDGTISNITEEVIVSPANNESGYYTSTGFIKRCLLSTRHRSKLSFLYCRKMELLPRELSCNNHSISNCGSLPNLPLKYERNSSGGGSKNNISTLHISKSSGSVVKQTLPKIRLDPIRTWERFDADLPYLMRKSLFPNVPPCLVFTSSGSKAMRPPTELHKILYWRTYELIPDVVTEIVKRSGFSFTENESTWISFWGRQMSCQKFLQFKENQKVNHFPGTFHLGRKDRLWLNIMRMQRINGKDRFSFMPQTFLLPRNLEELRAAWFEEANQSRWIIKPPASARGEGIRVVQRWSEIPKTEQVIVQRYVSQPYLINGRKFDLRIYVLITSFNPLRLYVYEDGLVRFASERYSTSFRYLGENFVHLTNYSINSANIHYTTNEDESLPVGHKWSLKCLWGYFRNKGINDRKIWSSIVDVVIKTVISCEEPIDKLVRVYSKNRYCCYELFGFDVMLDHSLKPWLLEVNISPSLHTDSQLDLKIKSELVKDTLNIIGLHVPGEIQLNQKSEVKLLRETGVKARNKYSWDKSLYSFDACEEDLIKQATFRKASSSHSSILKSLTPADVRLVVQSEDEFARRGNYIRIFPSRTSSAYLSFFEKQKYYNLLLDAWEKRYNGRREKGIQHLLSYCDQGVHLQSVGANGDGDTDKSKQKLVLTERSDINSKLHLSSSLKHNHVPVKRRRLKMEKPLRRRRHVSFLPSVTNMRNSIYC